MRGLPCQHCSGLVQARAGPWGSIVPTLMNTRGEQQGSTPPPMNAALGAPMRLWPVATLLSWPVFFCRWGSRFTEESLWPKWDSDILWLIPLSPQTTFL